MKTKKGQYWKLGIFIVSRFSAPGAGIIFHWKTEKPFCFCISAQSCF